MDTHPHHPFQSLADTLPIASRLPYTSGQENIVFISFSLRRPQFGWKSSARRRKMSNFPSPWVGPWFDSRHRFQSVRPGTANPAAEMKARGLRRLASDPRGVAEGDASLLNPSLQRSLSHTRC